MANPSPLLDFDVAALSQKLRAKEISPVELTQAYLDRIEAVDERISAYITVTAEAARDDGARGREGNHRRPMARAVSRRADRAQGSLLHQGYPDHRRLENPWRVRSQSRLNRMDAAQRSRRGAARQAQPARVRLRRDLQQSALGHLPQSLRPRPHPRRFQRRLRRSDRRAHRGGNHRHRHRRLNSDSRGVLRMRRTQTDLEPRQPLRRHAALGLARPRRPDHPHRARRRADAQRHRGARPQRRDLQPRAGARLHQPSRRRPQGDAHWRDPRAQ